MQAADIPDALIQAVQEILPNKSRQVIIRQLQRSGLEVDAAVNFLLASEDGEEEGDEPFEGEVS